MITDTFLCEKRQEMLGLFSLEGRQVCGGTRTACEPCSTDSPLLSPFLIPKREKDVQRRVDVGKCSPSGCLWRDFKGNPVLLWRNPSLRLGEGDTRAHIPVHWEMPKNANQLQSCGLPTGPWEQHQPLFGVDLVQGHPGLSSAWSCASRSPAGSRRELVASLREGETCS